MLAGIIGQMRHILISTLHVSVCISVVLLLQFSLSLKIFYALKTSIFTKLIWFSGLFMVFVLNFDTILFDVSN